MPPSSSSLCCLGWLWTKGMLPAFLMQLAVPVPHASRTPLCKKGFNVVKSLLALLGGGVSWDLWRFPWPSVWTCGSWVQSAPCASTLPGHWDLLSSRGESGIYTQCRNGWRNNSACTALLHCSTVNGAKCLYCHCIFFSRSLYMFFPECVSCPDFCRYTAKLAPPN